MPQGARVTASMPTFVRCLRVGYGLKFDFGVLFWVEISTTKGNSSYMQDGENCEPDQKQPKL